MADPRRLRGLTPRLLSQPQGVTVLEKRGSLTASDPNAIGQIATSKRLARDSADVDLNNPEEVKRYLEQLQTRLREVLGPLATNPFMQGTYHRSVYFSAANARATVKHRLKTKVGYIITRNISGGGYPIIIEVTNDDKQIVFQSSSAAYVDIFCFPLPSAG